jgi:hypothetical protein
MVRAAAWFTAALTGAALVVPASAFGQGPSANPLAPGQPLVQPSIPSTTPSTTPLVAQQPTTSSGGSGLSGSNAIAIAIGAVVILGAISMFIWRDARRRAPVRQRAEALAASAGGRAASKQKVKPRKHSPAERRRRKRGRAR